MAQPELKTNDILRRIESHEGPMDAFTFRRYLKEIEEIAQHDACAAFHLKGVLHSVYQPHDSSESLDNFAKALRIAPASIRPELTANYSIALFIYKQYKEFADMAKQAIEAGVKTYGDDSSFIKEVTTSTVKSLLRAMQFVEAKQFVEQLMQIIPAQWFQQDALVRFLGEQDSLALLQELQTQEDICQAVLADTAIERASYFITPDGDCIITLKLDAESSAIMELTERKMQLMMEREFVPSNVSVLLN